MLVPCALCSDLISKSLSKKKSENTKQCIRKKISLLLSSLYFMCQPRKLMGLCYKTNEPILTVQNIAKQNLTPATLHDELM